MVCCSFVICKYAIGLHDGKWVTMLMLVTSEASSEVWAVVRLDSLGWWWSCNLFLSSNPPELQWFVPRHILSNSKSYLIGSLGYILYRRLENSWKSTVITDWSVGQIYKVPFHLPMYIGIRSSHRIVQRLQQEDQSPDISLHAGSTSEYVVCRSLCLLSHRISPWAWSCNR